MCAKHESVYYPEYNTVISYYCTIGYTTVLSYITARNIPGTGRGESGRGRTNISLSMNRTNRNRLPPVKDGESYPCGCGVCDKQYINCGNITLCHICKNMYVNKACNKEWRCMSCKLLIN